MKNYLVMTSINSPTIAVEKYSAMKDWEVIVVGDKKTPVDWNYADVCYLSPQKQESLPYNMIAHAPWNLPSRVNIGYLYAMEQGATFITQSDDDNIPNEHWGVPRFQGIFKNLEHDGFINIYKYFTDKTVWPRGLPLNKILETPRVQENKKECRVGVWQHLADKDTDVDAIYRLTSNQHIYFDQNEPLVLSTGTVSPFNCQSTTFQKDVYVLMYLPTSITPRASDIVRSLIAQPIMWQHGYLTGFTPPTVTQERNPHDYLKDFENEILIYLHAEDIFRITKNSLRDGASMSENLREAYQALINKELVPKKEMVVLEAWIKDIERIAKQ